MLTIRLNRTGRRNAPQFRLVVQEKTVAPGGRHVEVVGNWDPHAKKGVFKNERIQYWISQGAQASDTVHNLLLSQGVIEGDKRNLNIRPAKKESEEETGADNEEQGSDEAQQETEEVGEGEKKEEVNDEADEEGKADTKDKDEKEEPKAEEKPEGTKEEEKK